MDLSGNGRERNSPKIGSEYEAREGMGPPTR
jgi:hypothetical protein